MNPYRDYLSESSLKEVERFIDHQWLKTVRVQHEDKDTLLGLPFPYTIPCAKDAFQELYYWDTYFTCLGLIHSGKKELAFGNAKNLLHQVNRFGYVPNGNRTYYKTRSQPPYLAPLVELLSREKEYAEFNRECLPILKQEYLFWTIERATCTGLSRYAHQATPKELLAFAPEISARINMKGDKEPELLRFEHAMAECESGHDFSPRFENRCMDFCPVDLNSLLYYYECFFSKYDSPCKELYWQKKAANRKKIIFELCWNEEKGAFFDFDFVNFRQGSIISVASFQTMWAGLASKEQALRMVEEILPQLEFPFGIAASTPPCKSTEYQWEYPNGWAPHQQIVSSALRNYGYPDIALRIDRKYLTTVVKVFKETGDLWEKYNIQEGSHHCFNEKGYAMSTFRNDEGEFIKGKDDHAPAMMGWTAGVYLWALENHRARL
ncbi:MAG: trehalase family glycosidase [Verrucomicrobiota bacterium]